MAAEEGAVSAFSIADQDLASQSFVLCEKCSVAKAFVCEDVPPDSQARGRVKWDQKLGRHHFVVKDNVTGLQINIQTTSKRMVGCNETAGRIARLCYAKWEAGVVKEDVLAYRDEMYSRHDLLHGVMKAPRRQPSRLAGAALQASSSSAPPPSGRAAASPPPSDEQPESKPKVKAKDKVPRTPPEAHVPRTPPAADQSRKASVDRPVDIQQVVEHSDAESDHGSIASAVSQAEAVRDQAPLTPPLAGGSSSSRPVRSPPRVCEGGGKSSDARRDGMSKGLEVLRSQGRLEGSICITGRPSDKTNASINGLYALRRTPFHGAPSYEKVNDNVNRYIFYSATKLRWKISDKVNDSKPGFAYANVTDNGATPPSAHGQSMQWKVFDGKAIGYTKDPSVRCFDALETLNAFGGLIGLDSKPTKRGVQAADDDEADMAAKKQRKEMEKGKKRKAHRPRTGPRVKRPRESPMLMSRILDGAVEQAFAEERLKEALLIEGRSDDKTNASINGIYGLRSAPYHGAPAYEKLGGGDQRLLFYSATKGAWKISDNMNDKKTGFAYVRVGDLGKQPPSQALCKWRVFNGDGVGWKRDKNVTCVELAPALLMSLPNDPASKVLKSTGVFAHVEEAIAAVAAGRAQDVSDGDGSSSSADTDGSSDDMASGKVEQARVAALVPVVVPKEPKELPEHLRSIPMGRDGRIRDPMKNKLRLLNEIAGIKHVADFRPAMDKTGKGTSKGSSTTAAAAKDVKNIPKAAAPGRACAKMLVRAGLRCSCHFVYIHECGTCQGVQGTSQQVALLGDDG
mmetsp:Transcript_59611/g.194470  ORF Transcript_59611/g.194470 Transcript_59611/m.194470 type:complete len:796 (-) Transcript_59611:143-2530(-)